MEYDLLQSQAHALLSAETHPLSNAANLAAFIYEHMQAVNWVGFYFLSDQTLILGPFQGKVACTRIDMGKGVCGTAASQRKTLLVDDVHEFDGHIACDSASNAEVVVPLLVQHKVIGVLDIDSPLKNRFSKQDAAWLENLADIWIEASQLELLKI